MGGCTEEVAGCAMVVMRQGLPLKVGSVVNSVPMTGAINADLSHRAQVQEDQQEARAMPRGRSARLNISRMKCRLYRLWGLSTEDVLTPGTKVDSVYTLYVLW